MAQRLTKGDVRLISSGWTTVRPAASRGMTQTSSVQPPPPQPALTCPPRPCPFPSCDACFQEGKASCVMELWKRGGRGGWNTEEMTDTQSDMGTNRMMATCVRGELLYSHGAVGLLRFVQLQMLFREDWRRRSVHRSQVGA